MDSSSTAKEYIKKAVDLRESGRVEEAMLAAKRAISGAQISRDLIKGTEIDLTFESVRGSDTYLSRLRLNGRSVTASRSGSTSAEEVTAGMIDMYHLTQDGKACAVIYVCPYHKKISGIALHGFTFA